MGRRTAGCRGLGLVVLFNNTYFSLAFVALELVAVALPMTNLATVAANIFRNT